MLNWQNHKELRTLIRVICSVLIVTFSLSNIQYVQAQDFNINQLPMPGTMVEESVPFSPLALKGLVVNLNKPLEFQFIVDTGRGPQDTDSIKDQTNQLVKYFLAGITIPQGDLWVNLSPYEKNRIVPSALGQTDLGRDLLAQDYILKQLTASLIYPERDLGKEFWAKIYSLAQKQFGTTNVPINTFNKVWILPDEAEIFEKNNAAYVTKSTLKVMLDEDYLATLKHQATQASGISSQIVREIVLPEIEKEVNTGKNFARLRQIYQALILAKWYKETIQNGLMDALYTNKKKVIGVNVNDPAVKEEIYQRYLKAYKKGAFNYIKEDSTPDGQVVPRKYFSGGITQMGTFLLQKTHDEAMLSNVETTGALLGVTVDCGIENNTPKAVTNLLGLKLESKPVGIVHLQSQPTQVKAPSPSVVKKESVVIPVAQEQQPIQPVTTLVPSNSFLSDVRKNIARTYDQAMVVVWAVIAAVGYFIYQIVKSRIGKNKETRQEIVTVNPVQITPAIPIRVTQSAIVPQRPVPQSTGSNNYQNSQVNSRLPLELRHELERQIEQLGHAVAESSKVALIRSFRPTGPGELPLPIPITMLNQDANDRDKVIHILENMQRMMDGTDEKVLRDFERAIDNARDRVTQQALTSFDNLSDSEIMGLLTNGYIQELQREFQQIFDEQVQHMIRFYTPSSQEQNLFVSEEINEKYPRLPRYLKWILTNNPDLENDYYVREWLTMIQNRVNQIPAFPDMITGYSKVALTKSLYLNPELAKRVLLFLTRNASRNGNGYASDVDVRNEIQQELARSISEDHFIEAEVVPDETSNFPPALEATPQIMALPAPDLDKKEGQKAKLKALTDDYTQFMVQFREQQGVINKVEVDIKELSEGLAEAKRQNDKVIIEALQPAVEGLTSKLRKLNEKMSRLNLEKARYEGQIKALRFEIGETGGTNLYQINPAGLGVVAVFTVMFGIPLFVTKKILNKWYNTTAGKTLGLGASIASLVAGYYVYLGSLSPQIQQLITDPSHADPWLATFFAIWPIAILSGVWGGKVGKGWSHERLYRKANSAFKKENYDQAIDFLNQAIKLKPKDTNDYTLLGEAQSKKLRYNDAIASYKKALEIDPNNSTTHNNLGVIYAESGDAKSAIISYKRSIELDPNDPVVLSNLGRALHAEGQLLDAARYFQRSQEIKPQADVTEELNQILHQIGRPEKSKPSEHLPFLKTMWQVAPANSKWIKSFYGEFGEFGGGLAFVGALLGGGFVWLSSSNSWWQMGTDHVATATQVKVWLGSLGGGVFLATGAAFVVGKIYDLFTTIFRLIEFPVSFKKIQNVNIRPSDQLSDKEIAEVAPMYARMSKDYLESIFRSWVEAGEEEKVARLLKVGEWDSDKTRIYRDIGEYKRVTRVAATKYATTVQDQKIILNYIDSEKDRLSQKGINNAIGLMKDILPQITDNTRTRDEFFFWLKQVVDLPKNVLEQGQKQILVVFTDLREYEQAKADAFRKFGPASNPQANAKISTKINELTQKLERDGLNNYPAILKRILADINNTSRNTDEFIFWVNEVLRFEKQWFSSGNYTTLLQYLIAYEKAKEAAATKFTRSPEQKNQLNQAVDSLRDEVRKKQTQGEIAILKDILPRVTEVSSTLAEFVDYITVLKSFDKNMWGNTQVVLVAFNNHVAYKQARENAVTKFASDTASRQKFLSDIDNLRAKLVAKGFPQASDLLKDILPELTKTCRTKEEFIFWFGELVGLNTSVWQRGTQAVINNFNDLAGYKLAKETAVEKLATTAQEKADLTASIDALKATLEVKVPSCAGFMKDVILEILKDINVLADPPHRKNDFLWYLGRVVNFETPTWVGGTSQVLAGYQEVKKYILQKRIYFAKFTTNTDEHQRLQAAYEKLDKNSNFTRPAFIGLLNNALEKVSKFAITPREFVYWVGSFAELNNDVLEVFCRDFDTVLAYYRDKGESRDFNHLPAVLNQYNKTYHQTVLITTNLLDILTDPGVDINKRIENASNFIVEQRIVKLGAPPNLIGLRDIVSFDQLLDNPDIGESQFRSMLNYSWTEESSDDEGGSSSYSTSSTQHIRQIASKMGTEGLYTYWEAQKPTYYQEFLNEGKGLIPGFNRPGEKFRVDYDGKAKGLTVNEQKEVQPMLDNIAELKILIQYLREETPNLYDNFIEPKRDLIKGRPLEEFITKESAPKVAIQLLNKVPGWPLDEQQKAIFIMKLMQIMAFPETASVRAKIAAATDSFERLREIADYWDKVWQYVQKQTYISQKAKYYSALVKSIRQKISMLNDKLLDVGDGVLQFYLSGHTMADFFRGSISGECTAYGGQKFKESIGQITDPGFFLFKIMEKGKWIGNIYSVATKTSDGKYALFVDWFKINRKHPFVTNAQWEDRRKKFIKNFFIQFKSYLASQGFDYLIFAAATGDSGSLFTLTQEEAKSEAHNQITVQTNVKKLGGMSHLKEGDLPMEYIQNFGDPGTQHDVTGYRITLDKTTPQILQQKQRDLEYLEKLLGEMSSEENRLAQLAKERKEELNRINQKGREAATSGQNTIASVLKDTSQQKLADVQKIEYELNELHIRMQEKRNEYEYLVGELGMRSSQGRSMASRVASVLIPFAITSTLFLTQKAQAHGYYSSEYSNSTLDLTPIYWIAGIGGFLGVAYYLLNKTFPPSQYDRGSYYERNYYPPYRYEDLSLSDDLKTLQGQVLDQVSPENRGLVPDRLDVKIPNQVGIPRSQGIKALTLLYSTILKSKSILDFFKTQDFYTKFKQRTHDFGLADDFDQPQNKTYGFTIGKEEVRYEEDRRTEEFIGQYLNKMAAPKDMDQPAIQAAMQKQRGRILSKEWFKGDPQTELYAYYQLMLANTAFESKTKVEAINRLLSEKNPLGAMSVLEEIYRIDIGGEQIALEGSAELRDALNKILQRELDDIHRQFNRSSDFQANKKEIIRDAKDIQFELRLSERTADDILRGVASGDCTSISGGSAYYNTIPQFMFDPGLQVFRVLQEGKWVGNVYTIVAEKNGKPVLIVDAIQLPVWGRSWPVSVKELADKVLDKVTEYAKDQSFDEVLMSSFVSNFNAIHDHFDTKYPTTPQEIEKIGGFDHLVSLGLWDNHAARNEYLETYSPQWNALKRVDPNNPKQTLMLRSIWHSDVTQLDAELESGNSSIPDMAMNSSKAKKPMSGLRTTIKKLAIGLMIATPLLFATAASVKAQDINPNPVVIQQVGANFNMQNYQATSIDPQVKGYLQQLSHAVSHLKTSSRLFSTNDLTGLDQVLNNIPQKVLDNEQANKAVNEIKQARADMNSTFFRINLKGANLAGQHTGDTQLFSFTKDGQKQLSIEGDIHGHLKAAKNLMKPLLSVKTGGLNLNSQGNVHEGSNANNLSGGAGGPNPPHTSLIGITGDMSNGHGTNATPVNVQTQQQIENLNGQLESAQNEIEKLHQTHSNLTVENNDLKGKLAQAQQQIDQLKSSQPPSDSVTQLENKKADLDRQVSDLNLQQNLAKEDLSRTLAEKDKVSAEVNSLGQQVPGIQQQAEKLKTEVGGLQTQKEQTQTQVTQLQTQKSDLETNVNQLGADRDNLQQQLDQLKQKVAQAKEELAKANERSTPSFDHIWSSLSRPEKIWIFLLSLMGIGVFIAAFIMWKKIKKYKDINDKVADLQGKAGELETQLQGMRQEQENLTRVIEEKKNQSRELDRQRQTLNIELQGLASKTEEFKRQNADIQAEITRAKEEKGRVIKELDGQIADLKRQVTEKETEITVLTIRQQAIASSGITAAPAGTPPPENITALNEEIVGLQRSIEALNQQKVQKTTEIEQTIISLNTQKETLIGQITVLQNELETIKLENTQQLQKSTGLKEEVTQLETALAELRQQKEIILSETSSLKGQQQVIDGKEEELGILDKQKQILQQEIANLESQKERLGQDVNAKRQETEAQEQRLKDIQNALETQTQANQETLAQQQTEIQKNEDQKQNLQEKINALNEELNQKRQEALETLRRLEEEKTRIKNELDTLLQERNTENQKIEELEQNITNLENEKNRQTLVLRGLESQVEVLRFEIAELQELKESLGQQREAKVNVEQVGIVVDELLVKANAILEGTDSLYLNAEAKIQSVKTFVSLIRQESHSGQEDAIRQSLKNELLSMGANVVLECGSQCSASTGAPLNLVVEFPATGKYLGKEGIIINAHMDTVGWSIPILNIAESDNEFYMPYLYFDREFTGRFNIKNLVDALRGRGINIPQGAGLEYINDNILTDRTLYKKYPNVSLTSKDKELIRNIQSIKKDELQGLNRKLIDQGDSNVSPAYQGSFGGDDKAGLLVQLEALRYLKMNYWDKGVDHRKIMFMVTAQEEVGYLGAQHLVEQHPDLFSNTLFSLTSDGPLEMPKYNPDTSFVVVVPRDQQKTEPYSSIIDVIGDMARKKNRKLELTELGLGMGDFSRFNEISKADLHIRSPYEGNHRYERVNIRNLIDHIDLWISLLGTFGSDIKTNNVKTYTAGSAKGKGMFLPSEHREVNAIILQAQRERRGELIWGNAPGWTDNRAKYAKSISWDIESLRKKYSSVKISKLGKVDIADILSSSSIVLIVPRANAPPGLVANNINSYQIAHNGLTQNSIYIDQYTFSQLQDFEIAILLAHEAIQLGAKKLAASKGIAWSEQLSREVTGIADEWETQIVGRSDTGNGSRFDDRIVEILELNHSKKPVDISQTDSNPQPLGAFTPPPKPVGKINMAAHHRAQQQAVSNPSTQTKKFTVDFPDTNRESLEQLRKMFSDDIFRDTANLPVKWEGFPAPMAKEIREANQLGKISAMPLDPDLLAVLTVFFSGIFPTHTNTLIQYFKTMNIFIINNHRSTFGATLEGDTFYIQKSLFDDLLGRSLTVDEINQRIKNKDRDIIVALFRIIIHEIGAGFFKTSHESNQELERLFTGLLTKTSVVLPYQTQEEFHKINATNDLNRLQRQDWAIYQPFLKGGIDLNQINIKRTGNTIIIKFDPAQLNAIEQDGFEGFTPVITTIIHIQNPLFLFGINDSRLFADGHKLHRDSVTL